MLKSKLDIDNFEIVDKTFSLIKANIVCGLFVIPMIIVLSIICSMVYANKVLNFNLTYFFVIVILGIIVHEFVHGFIWHLFSEDKWKSIKFGIDKKTFSPYTHCNEILPINSYRIGVISPFLVTGVLPFIIGLVLNNITISYASNVLICCACGDLMIFSIILKEKGSSLVMDHPQLCGCTVYRAKKNIL